MWFRVRALWFRVQGLGLRVKLLQVRGFQSFIPLNFEGFSAFFKSRSWFPGFKFESFLMTVKGFKGYLRVLSWWCFGVSVV